MMCIHPKYITYYTLDDAFSEIIGESQTTFAEYVVSQAIATYGLSATTAAINSFVTGIYNRFKSDGFCYNEPQKQFAKLIAWVAESWEQIKLLGSSTPSDYFAKMEDTSTTGVSEHPQSSQFSLAPSASSDKMSNLAQTRLERDVVAPYRKIQTLKENPIAWWDVYYAEYERRFVCNNTEEYL